MSSDATFRAMHPIARDLVGRLFEALSRYADELIAKDTSSMTLIEGGRWSVQVLRLMKTLQKDFPESDSRTKEGRQSIKRLRTPEEEEMAAEFDSLFGLNAPPTPKTKDSLEPDNRSTSNSLQPPVENWKGAGAHAPAQGEPTANPQPTLKMSRDFPPRRSQSAPKFPGPATMEFDHDAEIAEIVRRVTPGARSPPS